MSKINTLYSSCFENKDEAEEFYAEIVKVLELTEDMSRRQVNIDIEIVLKKYSMSSMNLAFIYLKGFIEEGLLLELADTYFQATGRDLVSSSDDASVRVMNRLSGILKEALEVPLHDIMSSKKFSRYFDSNKMSSVTMATLRANITLGRCTTVETEKFFNTYILPTSTDPIRDVVIMYRLNLVSDKLVQAVVDTALASLKFTCALKVEEHLKEFISERDRPLVNNLLSNDFYNQDHILNLIHELDTFINKTVSDAIDLVNRHLQNVL